MTQLKQPSHQVVDFKFIFSSSSSMGSYTATLWQKYVEFKEFKVVNSYSVPNEA